MPPSWACFKPWAMTARRHLPLWQPLMAMQTKPRRCCRPSQVSSQHRLARSPPLSSRSACVCGHVFRRVWMCFMPNPNRHLSVAHLSVVRPRRKAGWCLATSGLTMSAAPPAARVERAPLLEVADCGDGTAEPSPVAALPRAGIALEPSSPKCSRRCSSQPARWSCRSCRAAMLEDLAEIDTDKRASAACEANRSWSEAGESVPSERGDATRREPPESPRGVDLACGWRRLGAGLLAERPPPPC